MVSGKPPKTHSYSTLCFDAKHYHTVETLSLMLFYEIIHQLGYECPEI